MSLIVYRRDGAPITLCDECHVAPARVCVDPATWPLLVCASCLAGFRWPPDQIAHVGEIGGGGR